MERGDGSKGGQVVGVGGECLGLWACLPGRRGSLLSQRFDEGTWKKHVSSRACLYSLLTAQPLPLHAPSPPLSLARWWLLPLGEALLEGQGGYSTAPVAADVDLLELCVCRGRCQDACERARVRLAGWVVMFVWFGRCVCVSWCQCHALRSRDREDVGYE